MSLLPNQSWVTPTKTLWAPLGSGGGGGGGGGSTITVSTIQMTSGNITGLSSIQTNSFLDLSGQFNVFSQGFGNSNVGFEVYNGGGNTTNALADYDAGASGQGAIGVRGYSTISGSQTIDALMTMTIDNLRNGQIKLQHEWAGVSTMGTISFNNNGTLGIQALPPGSGGAGSGIDIVGNKSTITFQPQGTEASHFKIAVSTNTYVPQAGTTQNLGAFTSVVGNLYDIRLPVRIDAVSQPTAGDWAVIGTDTATANVGLGTFELAQVSSVGNQYESHLCGSVIASGTTTTLTAIGKLGAGTSTAVTVTGSAAFIRNLGIPQNQ